MNQSIVELVQFKLKSGVSEKQLEATHESINAFLQKQPGFIYRSLSQDSDNQWIDIVYWESLETAKAASDALMQDPDGQAMVALCDMDSVSMKHLPAITEAMSASCASVA